MRYLGLILFVSFGVNAAGLGNLFGEAKKPTAPTHTAPQPQPPKTPPNNTVIQQAARPQPVAAPKPAPAPVATKPSNAQPNTPTTVDNKNCSPTDSTCKR